MQSSARRDTHEDAFSLGNCLAGGECVFVLDREHFVIDGGVQSIRNKACANTLDLVRTSRALGKHRRRFRFNCDNLHIRILGLEVFTDTRDRSTSTYACDENVNLAIRVFPNFRTRRCLVGGRVCRVHELTRDKAVRNFLREFCCASDCTLHALSTFGENDFCTVGLDELATFNTHGFRHHDDDAVAASGGDRSKTDTSVTRSRFYNHGTRLKLA